ncbi:crossover junction endodeoxyribonuclease RuvC [Candidatus Uhrbacteria bacterium]|nr:crossover junction endodeoxyribonuclease RuvC [Candidatus Uhrbacteria bacterium]
MRLLGIDPGFDRNGFGVVEDNGGKLTHIAHGVLQTSKDDSFMTRLRQVRDNVASLIDQYKPDCVAVEQLFFQTNAKTAMNVAMARGVILLAIADAGIKLVEPTPNQVKSGTTGQGNADKKQVQEMVKRLLKLDAIPKPDDAADALAVAIVGCTLSNSVH